MGRPADDHERRGELSRVRRRCARPGDDAGLPPPGGAVRHRVPDGRRDARRPVGAAVPGVRGRRGVPRPQRHRRHRRERAPARARVRARDARPRGDVLRDLRRGLLPREGGRGRRRRRLRDGGGAVPDEVRVEGDDRAPARRVPRLADHGRPRAEPREDRVPDAVRRRGGPLRRRREDGRRPPAQPRDGRHPRRGGGRPLRRNRPRPEHAAVPRRSSTTTRRAT